MAALAGDQWEGAKEKWTVLLYLLPGFSGRSWGRLCPFTAIAPMRQPFLLDSKTYQAISSSGQNTKCSSVGPWTPTGSNSFQLWLVPGASTFFVGSLSPAYTSVYFPPFQFSSNSQLSLPSVFCQNPFDIITFTEILI